MTRKESDIGDRVASFLKAPTTSADAATLLEAVREDRAAQEAKRDDANSRSLDPLAGTQAATDYRTLALEIGFSVERLERSEAMLAESIAGLREKEAESGRQAAYDAAKATRDALTTEIAERYPDLVAALVALASRIRNSNEELERVNSARPQGGAWLDGAEGIARQFGRTNPGRTPHTIPAYMRLPALVDADGVAWPPRGYFMGGAQ